MTIQGGGWTVIQEGNGAIVTVTDPLPEEELAKLRDALGLILMDLHRQRAVLWNVPPPNPWVWSVRETVPIWPLPGTMVTSP
jgi:hypothetical protein